MDNSDTVKEIDELYVRLATTGSDSKGPSFFGAKHCLLIFLRSAGIASLIFLVTTLALPPVFDGVDDAHMMLIASGIGACQQPDPHIVFGHIYWGQTLAWLYNQNADVPWYGISLCLAHIFSLAIILSVFSWERASTPKKALLLGLYIFSLISLWTNLQFTSAAIFLTAAACLALLSTLETGSLSRSGKAVAIVIAIAALMAAAAIRPYGAILMVGIFAGLICCRFATLNFGFKDGLAAGIKQFASSKLFRGLVVVASMLGFLFVFLRVNDDYYKLDPKWLAFERERAPMVAICDFQQVVYSEKTKPALDALGWTNSDLELFQNYYYPIDPTLFSVKNAQTLLHESQGLRNDLSPLMVLREVCRHILNPIVLPGMLIAFALLPLSNSRIVSKRRQIVYVIFLVGLIAYLLLFMKLVMRITIPFSAWTLLLAIYYCDESKLASTRSIISSYLSALPFASQTRRESLYAMGKKVLAFAIAPLVVLAVLVIAVNADRSVAQTRFRQKFKDCLTAIRQKAPGAKLFITPSFVPFDSMSPFENPRIYFEDMAILIPYFAPSPLRKVEPQVIKDTQLPLLDDGVYMFSSRYMNERLKDYYWNHHRLRVAFDPIYVREKIKLRVFKARVVPNTYAENARAGNAPSLLQSE